jgi:hypothetical protein
MVKVLSRYGSDSFLSVWYHHGTDSGNFQKNFHPYLAVKWEKINENNLKIPGSPLSSGKLLKMSWALETFDYQMIKLELFIKNVFSDSTFKNKLKPKGQNLGRAFNSRCGRACLCHAIVLIVRTAELKVENSARTTFRLSTVSFHAPRQFP